MNPAILAPVPTFDSYNSAWFARVGKKKEEDEYHPDVLGLLWDIAALDIPLGGLPERETELERFNFQFPIWEALKTLCLGRNMTREHVLKIVSRLRKLPESQVRNVGGRTTWDHLYWLGIRIPGYSPRTPPATRDLPFLFWRVRFGEKHLCGGTAVPDSIVWTRFQDLYEKFAMSSDKDYELFCGNPPHNMSLIGTLAYLNTFAATNQSHDGGAIIRLVSPDQNYFEISLLGNGGSEMMYGGCAFTPDGEYRGWSVNT